MKNGIAVQPGIFHIHCDTAEQVSEQFVQAMMQLGFYLTDFSEFPDGHPGPVRHFTFKTRVQDKLDTVWEKVVALCKDAGIRGYLEGEKVESDEILLDVPRFNEAPAPFSITRRSLTVQEGFRETELHVAYRRDTSHEQVWKDLAKMGFMIAVAPKIYGKKTYDAIIATIQGHVTTIRPFKEILITYLLRLGGISEVTLKEEVILKYHLLGITTADLPSIVDSISLR